ncbi:MAG: dihydroorotase [Planctomycetota bacterium]
MPAPTDRLLIRNGRVIDPASGRDAVADVAVEAGRVAAIGPKLEANDAEVVDAEGCLVTPGLIDPHVHLREPGQEHKETIATGTRAAAAGGFTTVCCMPNTSPALDTPEILSFIREKAAGQAARVFAVAAATVERAGERMTDIERLVSAGAVGISDDGDAVADAGMMNAVLRACAQSGVCFMQHAQEPALTRGSVMNAGETSVRLGLTGWPKVAEEVIVARDILLAAQHDARYHVQHVSSAATVRMIGEARARGEHVSGEASPHHLHLTDDACDGFNTAAKMNPPLRTRADVDALRAGVAGGTITVLATDHAPHTADEKAAPFEEAPFGIIGLETALPLYAEALVHTGAIDWPRLVEMLTFEPARLCNLDRSRRADDGLGELFVGGPADLTVIAPDDEWTVSPGTLAGMSTNTPFMGRTLKGRCRLTVVGGAVIHPAE